MNSKDNFLFFLVFFLMHLADLSAIQSGVDFIKYPNFANFIAKFGCSEDIQQLAQTNSHNIKSVYPEGCFMPDYMNKFMFQTIPYVKKHLDISRVKNAYRLEKVIKLLGLNHLRVPKKCIIQDDGKWFILAEKIDLKPLYPFTLDEIKKLVKIVEETGFSDWGKNIARDQDNSLVFIDTEDLSFTRGGAVDEKSKADILKYGFYSGIDEMEPKAVAWLKHKIEELKDVRFNQFLCFDIQYDDSSINFEKASIEYQELQRAEKFTKIKQKYGNLAATIGYIFDSIILSLSEN